MLFVLFLAFSFTSCDDSAVHTHEYGEWIIDEAKSIRTKKCSCGDIITESIVLAADKDSLQKALERNSEQPIYLTDNIESSEPIKVNTKKLLNLNEKTIINETGNAINVLENGDLTIEGNGFVKAPKATVVSVFKGQVTIDSGTYQGKYGIENEYVEPTSGKIIINGGTFESSEFTLGIYGSGVLVVNDGHFKATDNAVIGTQGRSDYASEAYNITINGGTFDGEITTEGYIACGIYMANNGKVTLNGGIFNINGGVGIALRSGKLIVNNTTINLTHKTGLEAGKVGDSLIQLTQGSEIVIDPKSNYPGGHPAYENHSNYIIKAADGTDYQPEK